MTRKDQRGKNYLSDTTLKKRERRPTFYNRREVNLYGEVEGVRICSSEECGTRLSIHNPFDICNICREKLMENISLNQHGAIDVLLEFDKEHRVKPVKKYAVDDFLPQEHGLGTLNKENN